MNAVVKSQPRLVDSLPDIPSAGASYSFAGVRRENVIRGTHGIHKYPAKFIPQLPDWALRYDPNTPAKVVLDPFCGSGTTLVEAGLKGSHAIGIDINPLAVVLSQAKCTVATAWEGSAAVTDSILRHANRKAPQLIAEFSRNLGKVVMGVHETWSNWFSPEAIGKLVALREAIHNLAQTSELYNIARASLSAITKQCSFLSEDQLKVRLDKEKVPPEVFTAFLKHMTAFCKAQEPVSHAFRGAGASFEVRKGTATSTGLEACSVNRIVTSPPYINAIDYTMAHKYSLFVLGLLKPSNFKAHCRDYIGVTERAVRSLDIASRPAPCSKSVAAIVDEILNSGSGVAANRAYVVTQYFNGMRDALVEAARVLVPNGLYFLVIGQTNRICGVTVRTAEIVEEIANSLGLKTELAFFHALANKSSVRLNRSTSGGEIAIENIYAFRKIGKA